MNEPSSAAHASVIAARSTRRHATPTPSRPLLPSGVARHPGPPSPPRRRRLGGHGPHPRLRRRRPEPGPGLRGPARHTQSARTQTQQTQAARPTTEPAAGAPASSDLPADLVARATIPVEQARRTARAEIPGATLTAEELEEENGRLIYSFELTTAGSSGIDEVNVDANDGSVIDSQHESPADERAEESAESNP